MDFDEIIPRDNTDCLKYDAKMERFGALDIKPMWVADMDFRVPEFITQTFNDIVNHGIYGYHIKPEKYYEAIINWFARRHNYKVLKNDIFFTPGVVPAISYIIQALTNENDKILVQTPVYYPFFSVIKHNNRQLVINELVEKNNEYSIDFDDFEAKAKDAKMFILCSPHNPVGRVWSKQELQRMADICLKYNVLVIADEIHNDLVYEPNKHSVFASLSPEIENITITCHAASKTFNLAGLSTAYIFIRNEQLRRKFQLYYANLHTDSLTVFGLLGTAEAFNKGDEWLAELKKYLWDNYQFLKSELDTKLPNIKVSPLEATYMVWLDFRDYKLSDQQLKQSIIEKAKLGLNDGPTFGQGGQGFQRINIACPRVYIKEAVEMLCMAGF
jgi:cystathionine beta-lyase